MVLQVLTILLQGNHLTAEERLACFGCTKGMAELVLQHAARTRLTLHPDAPVAATAAGGSSSSCRRDRAHAKAAQQLAAQSNNVALVLHGGLLTPDECLWQRITTMQLEGVQLHQSSGSQLQLHLLPHLHTLMLFQCRMAPSGHASNHKPPHSTCVRTLVCIRCTDGPFPSAALELIDPSQLQTVITDHTSITALLPQLPALQELRILPSVSEVDGESYINEVDNEGFQRLLAHPGLARVTLARVRLSLDHADKPCTWESLVVTDGVHLRCLARMPLAGIQSCVVRGCFLVGYSTSICRNLLNKVDEARAAVSSISRNAQHLVFQADRHNSACMWTPSEPAFEVVRYISDNQLLAEVTTLVTRCLAPGTALVLNFWNIGSPEVLSSLAAAPPALTTLCFDECRVEDMGLLNCGFTELDAACESFGDKHDGSIAGRLVAAIEALGGWCDQASETDTATPPMGSLAGI